MQIIALVSIANIVQPGAQFAYDVECYVGLERNLGFQQRVEIADSLLVEHGIKISAGEISVLNEKFLNHLKYIHVISAERIRTLIARNGGYSMHIDATTESGRGTLLVIYDYWLGIVLGAWKIPSENKETISECIKKTIKLFGEPKYIMRDLSKTIRQAIEDVVKDLITKPVELECQYHLECDIGKDILKLSNDQLCTQLRTINLREDLRALITETRRTADRKEAALFVNLFYSEIPIINIPKELCSVMLTITIARWILDYSHDSESKFPFDNMYYNFFLRCKDAVNFTTSLIEQEKISTDEKVKASLSRLLNLLTSFVTHEGVLKAIAHMEEAIAIFGELRLLLREEEIAIEKVVGQGVNANEYSSFLTREQISSLSEIESTSKERIAHYESEIKARIDLNSTSETAKRAYGIIAAHLKTHGKYAYGRIIEVEPAGCKDNEKKYMFAARTNNCVESLWGEIKGGERRRTGFSNLGKTFDEINSGIPLVKNLCNEQYLEAIVGGSLDNLPKLFAKADREIAETVQSEKNMNEEKENDDSFFDVGYEKTAIYIGKPFVRNKELTCLFKKLLPQQQEGEPVIQVNSKRLEKALLNTQC